MFKILHFYIFVILISEIKIIYFLLATSVSNCIGSVYDMNSFTLREDKENQKIFCLTVPVSLKAC